MNEREREFLIELRELLLRFNVELEATDDYPGYPECGQDINIHAYASSTYDRDGEETPQIQVSLGSSFDGKGKLPESS